MVTSAVYQPLDRLNPVFRYWHWAGVSNYTHRSRFAVTYVFVKQLGPSDICVQQSHLRTTAGTPYTEGTGPICRIPSNGLSFHVLGFLPRAPVLVLSTVIKILPVSFSWTRGFCQNPKIYSCFNLVLCITQLPRLIHLNRPMGL